jgi:nicotinamidase-related amidase
MTSASSPYVRSPDLLSRDDSRLLVVDVQEKLLPLIPAAAQMVANCRKLIDGARILGVPVSVTEQYPKGLGRTTPELAEHLPAAGEKLRFSSAEVLGWGFAGDDPAAPQKIVVCGIEAHVCVQQTVLDLISFGYRVYVPADAVASRGELDWQFALDRMSTSGAVITTTESVLFEWCEIAGTPEFKEISRLIKGA